MLVSQARRIVATIESLGEPLADQSDAELKKGYLSLRYRAKSGESLDRLLPECFALVREAGRRKLGMRHFDVQLIGGMLMHHRAIVEMQTGEGKTLTATLPTVLAAAPTAAAFGEVLCKAAAQSEGPPWRALNRNAREPPGRLGE